MKKYVYVALLGALMLSACSTGGTSSGDGSVSVPSSQPSTQESSSSEASSIPSYPIKLTREEVLAKLDLVKQKVEAADYKDPQSYQRLYADSDSTREGDHKKSGRDYRVDLANEKMVVGFYHNAPVEGAKMYKADWLYKNTKTEAKGYINCGNNAEVEGSAYSNIIQADSFNAALAKSTIKEIMVKDQVKVTTLEAINRIKNVDFTTIYDDNENYQIRYDHNISLTFATKVQEGENNRITMYEYMFSDTYCLKAKYTTRLVQADGHVLNYNGVMDSYKIGDVSVPLPGEK